MAAMLKILQLHTFKHLVRSRIGCSFVLRSSQSSTSDTTLLIFARQPHNAHRGGIRFDLVPRKDWAMGDKGGKKDKDKSKKQQSEKQQQKVKAGQEKNRPKG